METSQLSKFAEAQQYANDFLAAVISADQYGLIPTATSGLAGYFTVSAVEAALKNRDVDTYKKAALAVGSVVVATVLSANDQSYAIPTVTFVAGAALGVGPKIKEVVLNQWDKLDVKSKFA